MNCFVYTLVFKIVYVLKWSIELILELYNVFNLNTYSLFAQALEFLNFLTAENFLFKKSKFFKFC